MTPDSDLVVQVTVGACTAVSGDLLERAVRETFAAGGGGPGEISLTLLGDGAIRILNRDYLGEDRVTDVLAFSLGTGSRSVGDVYVGADQAARQAADYGVSVAEELVRLTIHGTLHVLGHEHPEGPERTESPMYRMQEALVAKLVGPLSEL
ncbi:MAG: rRNA maturation RNase YbeY [Gemmatimonadota bacterium]